MFQGMEGEKLEVSRTLLLEMEAQLKDTNSALTQTMEEAMAAIRKHREPFKRVEQREGDVLTLKDEIKRLAPTMEGAGDMKPPLPLIHHGTLRAVRRSACAETVTSATVTSAAATTCTATCALGSQQQSELEGLAAPGQKGQELAAPGQKGQELAAQVQALPGPSLLIPAALGPAAQGPPLLIPASLEPAAPKLTVLKPGTLFPASLLLAALGPAPPRLNVLRPAMLIPASLMPAALPPASLGPAALGPASLGLAAPGPAAQPPTALALAAQGPAALPPTALGLAAQGPAALPPAALVRASLMPFALRPDSLGLNSLGSDAMFPAALLPFALGPAALRLGAQRAAAARRASQRPGTPRQGAQGLGVEELQRDPGLLSVFGGHAVRLTERIDSWYAAGAFAHRPVGPLGVHVRLRYADRRWCGAIEQALGFLLGAYVVDNASDGVVLLGLMREVMGCSRKPPIINARFLDVKHDTSRHRVAPADGILVLIDALVIENVQVFNTLVDHAEIEKVVLIGTAVHAVRLMQNVHNVPPNCTRAILPNGDEFFPAPNYRNTVGDRNFVPRFLQLASLRK